MRIVALRLQPVRKQPLLQRESLLLVAGRGIEGDCHQAGQKQVSLLPYAVEQQLDRLGRPGLCMKRFAANIVVDGLRLLQPGALLHVGAALLHVTQAGKHCYEEECGYAKTGQPCPLQGCLYTVVQQGGVVSVGDGVWAETTEV